MKQKYFTVLLLAALLLLVPCTAFAIGTLSINGSSYDSTALAGNLTGTGWSWQASANAGQGELTLNGYNGSAIEATDGVLNIHLVGENIITSDALNVLYVHGTDTGLNLYGSDAATDTLTTRSTYVVNTMNPDISGINVTIDNANTIPFSIRDINMVLDLSQVTVNEWVPGFKYTYEIYGINISQIVNDSSILGITMQMDNAVFDMSSDSNGGTLTYGMWANSYYSSIQAVFNSCTFNLTDFSRRGWYTGRDLAIASSATYNDCVFNMHSSSRTIGLHVSSDNESGFGSSKLILNNPSGEIETAGLAALFSRGAASTLAINGSSMQAWQVDTTEITDPKIITVFQDASQTKISAKTVGVADAIYMGTNYNKIATRIIFTRLPYQPPQTGDTSTPVLYGILTLLTAAGILLMRKRFAR